MSFLFPAFLLGALAATVPVLLHFFARDRAPRLPFSDVRFLERAFVRRDRRRRLRELLLLALRVAALLLLAVAFARPFLEASGSVRRITIVAVDRSLSLSAPGQMALARELALEAVAMTPADESLAVVAFDDAAEVVARPAAGRQLARSAIERIVPTAAGTRYAAALAGAVELLDGRPGRIVVVTDLQEAGWPEGARAPVPEHVDVEVLGVPPVARNLAVTAAGSDAAGPVAVVLNTGPGPAETEATLLLDGREVDRRPMTLAPGASELRWDQAPDGARVVAISVSDRDGYRWDDTRYALLGPASAIVVHVVSNSGTLDAEAFYFAQALGVAPEFRPFELRPVTPAALTASNASDWQVGDVVAVVGTDGMSRSGRERVAAFVEAGGGLLLAVGDGVDPRLVRDLLGSAVELAVETPVGTSADAGARRFAVVDPRHPVFRPLDDLVPALGRVRFTRTARVSFSADTADYSASVLARFDHGDPALVEFDLGTGRALVFASDLNMEANDLPRHPGFVPLLQELVRYLAGPGASSSEVIPADAPPGVPRVPGVTLDPVSGRPVAVNVDPRESEPRSLTPDGFLARLGVSSPAASGVRSTSGEVAREAEQSLWWYVVLAMAVVLVGEAWLGRNMA